MICTFIQKVVNILVLVYIFYYILIWQHPYYYFTLKCKLLLLFWNKAVKTCRSSYCVLLFSVYKAMKFSLVLNLLKIPERKVSVKTWWMALYLFMGPSSSNKTSCGLLEKNHIKIFQYTRAGFYHCRNMTTVRENWLSVFIFLQYVTCH